MQPASHYTILSYVRQTFTEIPRTQVSIEEELTDGNNLCLSHLQRWMGVQKTGGG
jgi:hypothetical protein